jgi:peptidoglycan hydrolase-like protein with peptidoglycan-binding domain
MKSGDSSTKSAARGAGGPRERVRAVQQALKDKGADPGDIDGVMGPKTRRAVKEFQQKEGLRPTGALNGETLGKLGIETSAADQQSPSASPPTDPTPGAGSGGSASQK